MSLRFDVEVESTETLATMHNGYFATTSYLASAGQYFSSRFGSIIQQVIAGEPVFVTHLFYATLGYMLCIGDLGERERDALIKYVLKLRGPKGGFLAIPRDYANRLPKLGKSANSPMVPEVYSSYYSHFLLNLLDQEIGRHEKADLLSWVLAHQKTSGAVFNAEYSNTPEERRAESEVTAQTYFATELISHCSSDCSDYDLDSSLERIKNWVHQRYASLKTVAARYFAAKALHRIAPEEVANLGIAETLGFLEDRRSSDADGFYDYRLQDKADEAMTSGSLTELDKISSHIFSTYYASCIARFLSIHAGLGKTSMVDHEAIRLLVSKAHNPDNGFGMKVLIKDFEQPFGPTSTELETLLVLVFPALFHKGSAP